MHACRERFASCQRSVNPFIAILQTYTQHKRVKMPEIKKKIKRNHQSFAGCNLHRAVISPQKNLIGCVFSIEMHYRTSILHRAIFNRQPTKISGKIHCRTNMQESSKLSLTMPEIKKIKRNRQIFAGCNLHRAVIGPQV